LRPRAPRRRSDGSPGGDLGSNTGASGTALTELPNGAYNLRF
jgi:hypothetical protein